MTTGVCAVEDCERNLYGRGFCSAHYQRWRKTGSAGSAVIVRQEQGRTCSVDGCERKHAGLGYCLTHWTRFNKHGDAGSAEIRPQGLDALCSVDGCEQPTRTRGWCRKHYLRWWRTRTTVAPPSPIHGTNWTGDTATYAAVHLRLRNERGRAAAFPCVGCGRAATDWAYDHSGSDEKIDEKRRPYTTDLSHYQPMCTTCHRRFDVLHGEIVTCSDDACDLPQKALGLCRKHYLRNYRLKSAL